MTVAHPVAETFAQAAHRIRTDPQRQGNTLSFAKEDEVVYAGDIHGARANLAKIIGFADLAAHPRRRLVLQEIIHGGPTDADGGDRSVELLLRAARLKIAHPEGVFFLMANHDLAQVTGNEITKEGRGACEAFDRGLDHNFGPAAAEVRAAVKDFLRCLPLAAKCPNGIFLAHSLPSPNRMDLMDWTILDRTYRDEDLRRGGSAYEVTWGRGHTPAQLDALAETLGATQFLLGHQHIPTGHQIVPNRAMILASDHQHGAVAVFDAGEPVADDGLADLVRPIVAL